MVVDEILSTTRPYATLSYPLVFVRLPLAALLPVAGINAALSLWVLLLPPSHDTPKNRIATAYLSSLTLHHDSIQTTKDKAVSIRNIEMD